MRLGNLRGRKTQSKSVYSPEGIAPTICALDGVKCSMPYIEESIDG